MQALELRRVSVSADLEKAGDFAFVPKREPIREITRTPVDPPTGFFKALWWTLFGTKEVVKETILPLWPDYDAIVMNCPHCNQPIGTTKDHRIISLEPLTIEKPLACASQSHLWRGGITSPERRLFINQRRRARKAQAEGSHTQAEWILLKTLYGFTCPVCRRREPDIKLTEDHIIPIIKGGSDYIWNIQPLCLHCNVTKHTKIVEYQIA